ncbi:hypothetical protein SAMN04515658_10943 [Idiomarina zobellii]|jgi:hypothetical protein|nr:hypothetical protein DEU30_101951 [Idiomarina sp. 017G]SDF99003.1 hypothetical protein SAMN04515658_10943 [Idiomarina zobellii]
MASSFDTVRTNGDSKNAYEESGKRLIVYSVAKMDCPSEERMIRLA